MTMLQWLFYLMYIHIMGLHFVVIINEQHYDKWKKKVHVRM